MGKPAYQGRPDPQKIADRMMLLIVVLLILGFIRAGLDNRWFVQFFNFVTS